MTQASLSKELEDDIRDKFSINWKQTQYQDLWKPLYSGIAARLKIADYYKYDPIPQDADQQADFFSIAYTTNNWGNAEHKYKKAFDIVNHSKQSLFLFHSTSVTAVVDH